MSDASDVSVDAARLRPTFYLDLPVPADEAVQRIREQITSADLGGSTMAAGRYTEFRVDETSWIS